jgi:hypothetical protein
MATEAVIAIVVILIVVVAAALVLPPLLRRRRLQQRFGPEYERTVDSAGSRREAEQELAERERRFEKLHVRSLEPEQRKRYAADWMQVQERFVDDPVDSVATAQRLVTSLMAERGYPTDGYEQEVADLSVQHASVLDHYRAAHDLSERAASGRASTEDLRQGMVHYRELFADLLEERGSVTHE